MSTFNTFSDRNRDQQDGTERHIYSKIEAVDGGGHIIKTKGTGTVDEEVMLFNNGQSGNYPADTDAEVIVLAGGSDTNQKYALLAIPHTYERSWAEGTNGIQAWNSKERYVEFNKKRTHISDKKVAIGEGGAIEIVDGKVYIRGEVHIENLRATGKGSPNIPAFEK